MTDPIRPRETRPEDLTCHADDEPKTSGPVAKPRAAADDGGMCRADHPEADLDRALASLPDAKFEAHGLLASVKVAAPQAERSSVPPSASFTPGMPTNTHKERLHALGEARSYASHGATSDRGSYYRDAALVAGGKDERRVEVLGVSGQVGIQNEVTATGFHLEDGTEHFEGRVEIATAHAVVGTKNDDGSTGYHFAAEVTAVSVEAGVKGSSKGPLPFAAPGTGKLSGSVGLSQGFDVGIGLRSSPEEGAKADDQDLCAHLKVEEVPLTFERCVTLPHVIGKRL